MSESASARHRKRASEHITLVAQDLTDERGLDGWTMDELAEACNVSRRTLFNYFSGKLDAVLGAAEPPDPTVLAEFRTGGPTGHLATDAKIVIADMLADDHLPPERWNRLRRLVTSDARLHQEMNHRLEGAARYLAESIQEREGASLEPFRAHTLAAVILALLLLALESYVNDPRRTFAQYYVEAFEAATLLFAPPAP